MSHHCQAALIRCIDFRLNTAIDSWLEKQGLKDSCDIISIAGVGKTIAADPESPEAKYLLEQIRISVDLHQIKTVYIMQHTDCGAYGGHAAFTDEEEELKTYLSTREKVVEIIKQKWPNLEVKYPLADIRVDGRVEII